MTTSQSTDTHASPGVTTTIRNFGLRLVGGIALLLVLIVVVTGVKLSTAVMIATAVTAATVVVGGSVLVAAVDRAVARYEAD